jgi:hypothetical protein
MRSVLLAIASALAVIHSVNAAFCHGKPSPYAQPSNYSINTGAPRFINETNNAKLYMAGEPGFEFYVIHIWGSAYDLGYAHGSILRDSAQRMMNRTWAYLESQVEQELSGLPTWLQQIISNFGLDVALDLTWDLVKDFTPQHFVDEMQGLADAAGVDYDTVRRIHLIGELTQGDCSMYGASGSATASTGKTLQMRTLDWDVDGPFKDYPAVVVYHPEEGHAFANVGFLGWVGALSGQSVQQMAISEIGVAFPDSTFGNMSRQGVPFTFLLRDIMQFDNSYTDSIRRIQTANRTCDLILGVGDGKADTFVGFEYSHSVADVITPTTLRPVNDTWHPQIPDVTYWGMDWLCPGYNLVLSEQLQKYHGVLTPENTISHVIPLTETGNVHAVVYDLTDQQMYVSYARPDGSTVGPPLAYSRQFTQLDLPALWAEKPPAAGDSA